MLLVNKKDLTIFCGDGILRREKSRQTQRPQGKMETAHFYRVLATCLALDKHRTLSYFIP